MVQGLEQRHAPLRRHHPEPHPRLEEHRVAHLQQPHHRLPPLRRSLHAQQLRQTLMSVYAFAPLRRLPNRLP